MQSNKVPEVKETKHQYIFEPAYSAVVTKQATYATIDVVTIWSSYNICIQITPDYLKGPEYWPIKIEINLQKADRGTWIFTTRVHQYSIPRHAYECYTDTDVVIYVRTAELKKQWEDCLREIAEKYYNPRDVVPCQ